MSAATDVLAVSHSLRAEAADLKLTLPNKITVLGSGSSNGVAIPQSTVLRVMAVERRKELKIPEMPTIGYVGRLHPDKGLRTLFQACKILEEQDIAFQLILVGPEDPPGYFSQALQAYGPKRRLVMNVGPVGDPSPYYRAFDFLCLPTRREGFPNVVLEAAAHGVPTIATEATGCVDAIVDGETGVLVPIDDERQLASAIRLALSDPRGTSSLGLNARSRVISEFSNHRVWELHEKYYRSKVLK